MISELQKHDKLAIDFDDTLVGHKNSHLLWELIATTHLHKEFHIITFRSGAWANTNTLIDDMMGGSRKIVRPYMISSISHCDDDMYNKFAILQMSRKQTDTLVPTIILPEEDAFFKWKGFRAKELGCTVLVDDRPEWVLDGCKKYGIKLVDTADLI